MYLSGPTSGDLGDWLTICDVESSRGTVMGAIFHAGWLMLVEYRREKTHQTYHPSILHTGKSALRRDNHERIPLTLGEVPNGPNARQYDFFLPRPGITRGN